MTQLTFAEAEYRNKKHKTRRERFLERMDALIPWSDLEALLGKYYHQSSPAGGRPPYPLACMLRVHCMQLFYNLSDPAMEDALYEIESMRQFAGLKLSDRIPDESTILNFRHILERHDLGTAIFTVINHYLEQNGLLLREGTIVDATIIEAPSSTKNREKKRDPEMHQTKKGGQWHFGMKMHIGVDEMLGVIHSVETTAANHHDITATDKLLHGDEQRVFGDSGYRGVEKRTEHKDRRVDWNIAMMPSKRRDLPKESSCLNIETLKASIRAKVEHPFLVIKRQFGYGKVRYRGLHKNAQRLSVLAGFCNLLKTEKYLLA